MPRHALRRLLLVLVVRLVGACTEDGVGQRSPRGARLGPIRVPDGAVLLGPPLGGGDESWRAVLYAPDGPVDALRNIADQLDAQGFDVGLSSSPAGDFSFARGASATPCYHVADPPGDPRNQSRTIVALPTSTKVPKGTVVLRSECRLLATSVDESFALLAIFNAIDEPASHIAIEHLTGVGLELPTPAAVPDDVDVEAVRWSATDKAHQFSVGPSMTLLGPPMSVPWCSGFLFGARVEQGTLRDALDSFVRQVMEEHSTWAAEFTGATVADRTTVTATQTILGGGPTITVSGWDPPAGGPGVAVEWCDDE